MKKQKKQNKQEKFLKKPLSLKEREEQNQREAQATINAMRKGLLAGDKTE